VQVKNSISNYIGKAIKLATLGLVGFVVVDNHKHTLINLERCKQEIYKTDSVRYNKLNNSYEPVNRYSDYKVWYKEREEMIDSLRTLGTAQKAYLEGAQLAQDSISNAKVK
jgi:hypothetical protein